MFGVTAKDHLYLAVGFVCIMKANLTQMSNSQSFDLEVKTKNEKTIFEHEEFKRIFPNWVSYDNVSDLYFPNEDNWIDFKSKINNAIANVIENNPLNNVDQFIRFIQDYKNQRGNKKSLDSFFNQYNAPFRPLENRVSFLFEIYRQLTESYPQAKDLMTMVQAYVDPPENIVEELKKSHAENRLKDFTFFKDHKLFDRTYYQLHMAGVIRITIDKNLKEKGIILLDPGYMNDRKRVNPYCVVLMENTTSEHHGVRLYGNEYGGIDFTMGPEFVLASGKLTKETKRNALYSLQYHPRFSYSLCKISTQRNIMAPSYGIMTFHPNGFPKAYLTFKVVPENVSNKSHSFLIGPFNRATETYLPREVTFESLKANTTKGNKDANLYFMQLKKGDNLLTKLQTLQSELFEDPGLVSAIYNLTNYLNPKKPLTRKEKIDIELDQLRTNESGSEHSEFGCTFENKKYKLDTDSPIWSSKCTQKELIFKDMDEWLNFQGKIRQAFTDVMKRGYALNNVDHFIRFIEAYKNQNGDIQKNLESFFDDYHVPEPLEDPVSLLVKINQRLKEIYPLAWNLMYMVSAYVNPLVDFVEDVRKSRDNIKDYAEKKAEYELTQPRFQGHIAGIIKIQVNNTKGIVLLDPGYSDFTGLKHGFPNSFFILEENNYNGYNRGYLYGQSRVLETVLAHKFGLVVFKTPYNNYYDPRILYLRNKPFCSFMDSTIKGNLLVPYHGILTFDEDGSPKGYLTFNIVDQYKNKEEPYFLFGRALKENKTDKIYFEQTTWYYDAIEPENNMNEWAKDVMKNATEFLGNDFLSKLRTIRSNILQDRDLLSEIYNLNQKLMYNLYQTKKSSLSWRKSKIQNLFYKLCGTLARQNTSQLNTNRN